MENLTPAIYAIVSSKAQVKRDAKGKEVDSHTNTKDTKHQNASTQMLSPLELTKNRAQNEEKSQGENVELPVEQYILTP